MAGTNWFRIRATTADAPARAFVWAVWLLLVALAVFKLITESHKIPVNEDWFLVPAFTGNEVKFPQWLWKQNAEHRVPLPKLIMVGILKLSRGDFRAIQLMNITLLAATSAALI